MQIFLGLLYQLINTQTATKWSNLFEHHFCTFMQTNQTSVIHYFSSYHIFFLVYNVHNLRINEAKMCFAHINDVLMNEVPPWTSLDVNEVLLYLKM